MRRSLSPLALALLLAACSVPSNGRDTFASSPASRSSSTPVVKIGAVGQEPPKKQKPKKEQKQHHEPHQRPTPNLPHVPAVDMPRRWLTPGVALPVGTALICRPGYASSVRDVPDTEKSAVYARYGIAWLPYRHEVDHLISLELGGSNAIRNLWPEPYAGRWGAKTKDVLENRLHDLVCAGSLSLASAQHQEATNWVAAYLRYVGTAPGGNGGGNAPGGYFASRYPTASTIYCADDPEWRNLSPTYLAHFDTWAQAHARFPTYHLHQPC